MPADMCPRQPQSRVKAAPCLEHKRVMTSASCHGSHRTQRAKQGLSPQVKVSKVCVTAISFLKAIHLAGGLVQLSRPVIGVQASCQKWMPTAQPPLSSMHAASSHVRTTDDLNVSSTGHPVIGRPSPQPLPIKRVWKVAAESKWHT